MTRIHIHYGGKAGGGKTAARDANKVRLTPEQKKALEAYEYALRQEDRYLGSVFVTSVGQRAIEAKTKEAYERCKRLGMGVEHGL
jgi:electron transfer flavoprotein alpha/beta subunit